MPKADVLVIGGGAAGAAVARALAVVGTRVTVVRPEPLAGEAWRAAAGMLAAQIEATADDPLFSLGVAGRAFYRREAEPLLEGSGIDIGLEQTGIVQIAATEAQLDRFKAKVAWQRQQAESAELLQPADVADAWPWLQPGLGAFWAPEDGTVRPDRLVAALLGDAERLGATVVTDTITSLLLEDAALKGATGRAARYQADVVVLAAGAWSGRIANLPRPLSVEPVRGQILAWQWLEERDSATVYGDRCYLLRRGDQMLGGSTMEHAGFNSDTSEEATRSIVSRLVSLDPSLAFEPPLRTWAGLRPGTPDGIPVVGPEPRLPGLWYATGFGRNGVLLAGIIGELVAQSITGQEVPDVLQLMRPGRFWDW